MTAKMKVESDISKIKRLNMGRKKKFTDILLNKKNCARDKKYS